MCIILYCSLLVRVYFNSVCVLFNNVPYWFVYTLVTFMYSLIRVYSKLAKTIIFYRKFKGPKKYRFLIKIILGLERKIVQGRESFFWSQFKVNFFIKSISFIIKWISFLSKWISFLIKWISFLNKWISFLIGLCIL